MIESLSLSSSFPAWTWEQSNGVASDSATQAAYSILTDQGRKCMEFSRFVWNDIIDVLVAVLDEMGVEWDAKYCTAEEAKIMKYGGILMAYAWNSVAWNIKRFGFVAWKWARVNQIPGCLGREQVNGYSTHGEYADYLYAWYLLELTKKLNRLIEVFKDEADFGDFESIQHSSTAIKVKMSAPKIEAITAGILAESFGNSPAFAGPAVPGNGIGAGYTMENGILLPIETSRFYAWQNNESHEDARPDVLGITRLHADAHGTSFTDAGIKVFGIAPMKNAIEAITKHVAYAVSPGSKSAKSVQHVESHLAASVVAPISDIMAHVSVSESKNDAEARAVMMKLLETARKSETMVDANMRADNPTFLEGAGIADSKTDARPNALQAQILYGLNKAESHISGLLSSKQSNPLRGYIKAVSDALAKPEAKGTSGFKSVVQSMSKVVATLDFWKEVFEWIDPIQTGSNLYIQSVWKSWSEADKAYIDVAEFYAPVQAGSDLYIQSAYRAYADGNEGFIDTDVYYEPVQTGSNLFITSAESIKGDFENG